MSTDTAVDIYLFLGTKYRNMLPSEDQERIVKAIRTAESLTSGEIRLVIDQKMKKASPLDAAVHYFRKLGMHKTERKNGVLIYMALDDHQFAIIGDHGINQLVNADFWDETKERMLSFFRKEDVVQGLIEGIEHAGEQLKQYFPREDNDVNELPDDIHFGDN